jgi:hypothetical protein
MPGMNSFERIATTPAPSIRVPEPAQASESQQQECCCPELCLLDHDN